MSSEPGSRKQDLEITPGAGEHSAEALLSHILRRTTSDLPRDTRLAEIGLDSLQLLQAMLETERSLGVRLDDEAIDRFLSSETLAELGNVIAIIGGEALRTGA